jgi:hypothetical protein
MRQKKDNPSFDSPFRRLQAADVPDSDLQSEISQVSKHRKMTVIASVQCICHYCTHRGASAFPVRSGHRTSRNKPIEINPWLTSWLSLDIEKYPGAIYVPWDDFLIILVRNSHSSIWLNNILAVSIFLEKITHHYRHYLLISFTSRQRMPVHTHFFSRFLNILAASMFLRTPFSLCADYHALDTNNGSPRAVFPINKDLIEHYSSTIYHVS